MAYIVGDRKQMTFLPPVIDDYIGTEDPVRVYDAFIEAIDIRELGIKVNPYKAGAHEYHPNAMLKLIVYGYSYGKRSSRKLERACHHNLSFMWLTSGLRPDYRTIGRFRNDNKEAIKNILKQSVKLCLKLDLVEGNTLFTDGSNFRANASIDKTWTEEKCKRELEKIEKRIDRIVDEAERIDREEEDRESFVRLKKEHKDKEKLRDTIKEISNKP